MEKPFTLSKNYQHVACKTYEDAIQQKLAQDNHHRYGYSTRHYPLNFLSPIKRKVT